MPAERARLARAAPASTSASTLTMTMCLPCAMAARAWRMPAAGLPVTSTTTSTSSRAIAAAPSSVKVQARIDGLVPADMGGGAPGAVDVEVGDGGNAEAGRGRRLGEEHGAELAGADDGDADRPLGYRDGRRRGGRGSWQAALRQGKRMSAIEPDGRLSGKTACESCWPALGSAPFQTPAGARSHGLPCQLARPHQAVRDASRSPTRRAS